MKEISFSKDSDKTLKLFRRINKFMDLTDDELANFVTYGKLSEYEANEIVIKEGDYDSWVHFLIKGSLKIVKGEHLIGSLSRCGDVFGEMGAVDGSARSATIVADSTVWLLSLDASVVEDKLKENHTHFCYVIYRIFSEVLAVRLRRATDENIQLREEQERLKDELQTHRFSSTGKNKNQPLVQLNCLQDQVILVVDSAEVTRKIIKSILKDLGFRAIHEAFDGFHALNILKRESIDLIISEWDLSRLSGLELLKHVRNDPGSKETPFIMMLHKSDNKSIDLAIKAQVNKCLMKPYSGNTVLETIEEILG